jgi:hypothetical protein
MLDRVVVDFVKTFGRPGLLLAVEPKMVRVDKDDPESEQVHGSDDQGNLKWSVTIAVPVKAYAREKFVNLTITVASRSQPCANVPPGQTVIAESLEMGIMKQEKSGYAVFFSAAAIRPVQLQPPQVQPSGQR